jgi:4-nitrophenyl phosphatase
LEARGAIVVREGPADTVVVGFHEDFDFWGLTAGVQAVLGGARLLGTNEDASWPAEDGIRPGAGALVAAVATAAGATPQFAGKPHRPICDLVLDAAGPTGTVVGDRPDTDGLLARALGWKFAMVLSGVMGDDDMPFDPVPDSVHADLAAVVDEALR